MSLQRFGTMHMTSTALCGGGAGGQPRPRSGPPPPALQRARGRAQGWRDRVTPPRGGLLAHAWGRPGGGPWRGGEYLQFRRIQTGFFGVLEEVLQGKRTGGREQGDGHAAATLGPRAAGASGPCPHAPLPVMQGQGVLRWVLAAGEQSLSQKTLVPVLPLSLQDSF